MPVLHEINEAVHQGEVDSSHLLSGIVAEIGTSIGRTDPNYVLTKQSKAVLSALVGETIDMMHHAKKS